MTYFLPIMRVYYKKIDVKIISWNLLENIGGVEYIVGGFIGPTTLLG